MAFGYRGDVTGDTLSLAGTGAFAFDDPERGGKPMVPLQDAALKASDAEMIYHVQPGETFVSRDKETAGQTFRYADHIPEWSPARPGYVDVYDPGHAPDSATTKGSNVSLRSGYDWTSPGTDDDTQTGDPIDDSKDQVELTNKQRVPRQRLSPLDSFKVQFPQFRTEHDAILLEKMHERMAPDMPLDTFSKLAQQPDGARAIQIELNKGLTGLQILRRQFAEFKATDDELLHGMYDRLASNNKIDPLVINFRDFKDQMDPGSGPLNAAYNLWKGMTRSGSAAVHEAAGQFYAKPQNAVDFANEFYKMMNFGGNIGSPGSNVGTTIKTWLQSADEWIEKNSHAETPWRDFVGFMNGWVQSQNQQAVRDMQRASQTRGIGGKESLSGKTGRVVGGTAAQLGLQFGTIWMPGMPLKTAMVMASAYEGLSRLGSAVQAGHDNALIEGFQGAMAGPLMRYMMESPVGRRVSAFNIWAIDAGTDNIDSLGKWLKGEKVDWYEQGLRTVVDLGFGVFAKHEAEALRTKGLGEYAAGEGIQQDEPGTYRGPYSYAGAEDTGAVHPAVSEELDKAHEARANGDFKAASEHLDAAAAISPPKVRDTLAKDVVKVTHDAANIHNGDTSNKTPSVPDGSDEIIHQNLYGLTPKRNKGARTTRESGFTLDWAGEMHDWFHDAWPALKKKIKVPIRAAASVFEKHVHDVFTPAAGSKTGEAITAISRERTSEASRRAEIFSTKMARDMEIEKDVKGGEKTSRRESVFAGMRDGQLKDILVNEEEHGDKPPNTGNNAANFILRFHRVGYKAMKMVEDAAGIKTAAIRAYIFHNLKDPKRGEDFQKWFDARLATIPKFTKHREYTWLRDALAAGFEMKTLNPERLFQARLFAHTEAIRKIFTLRDAADENGLAYRTDTPNLDPEIKKWVVVTSPERDIKGNHVTYYVEPHAAKVLKNAWDTRSIYDQTFFGPFLFKPLAIGKGLSLAIKFAWSFAHQLHVINMGLAHTLTQMTRMGLKGEKRVEAWQKALKDIVTLGGAYDREVKAWRGEELDRPLNHEEESNIADAQKFGLDFSLTSERNMQFARGLAQLMPQWAKVKGLSTAARWGYKALSSELIQHYMFNHTIPRMKFKAAMQMRDSIMRDHPEYNRPGMEMERNIAFSKAGEQIEARFGEMFYNNLYWNKMAKDMGIASLTAFGWNIGFVRIFGGLIHDMSSNVMHAGEIWNKIRGRPSEHTFLTDKIMFAGYYTALSMVENGIYNYVAMKMAGKDDKDALPTWRDYFYPRTAVDKYTGKDIRVQPIEYPREFLAWNHHIMQEGGYPMGAVKGSLDFWANKVNPFLQTFDEDFQNRNYFGLEIADKGDPNQFNQLFDHARFWASNLGLPIPFQGFFQDTGIPYSWEDAARSAAGKPRAPSWTMRSDTENRIADKYHTRFAGTKSKEDLEKQKAHQALRKAVIDKDEEEIRKAEDTLKALHVKPSAIHKLKKEARVPYETYMFKRLEAHDQQLILDQMTPEELKIYVPLAHRELRDKYVIHAD